MTTSLSPLSRTARWSIALGLLSALVAAFFGDAAVDHWVVTHRSAEAELLAKMCSRYFAWHWLMGAALLGFLLAWWRRREEWKRVLCVMMVAASLAGLSADVARGLTGRTRPSAVAAQGWYGIRSEARWLIFDHAYNSFPSGHTTAATGFVLPLFLWRRRFGALVFPFIVLVAGARIYVGAHHLSDVIAGAALGTLVAVLLWRRTAGGERLVNAARWPWARG